jgi:hypothetical protein
MPRRWSDDNDGPHTFETLSLVFVLGLFLVLWLVGYWYSEGF